jgi:hypothetical protein
MEDNFYNDEFEQFLQKQANNHRMYPSDGVWLGIYKKLHGHKTWPALTITAFSFFIATVAISLYFGTKPSIFLIDPVPPSTSSASVKDNNSLSNPLVAVILNKDKLPGASVFVLPTNVQPATATVENVLESSSDDPISTAVHNPATVVNSRILTTSSSFMGEVLQKAAIRVNTNPGKQLDELEETVATTGNVPEIEDLIIQKMSSTAAVPNPVAKTDTDPNDKNIADKFLEQHKNDIALYTTDRVLNNKKRWEYQVYITPSFSYRKLKEDGILNQTNQVNGPVALNYVTDVNKVVRHKPGVGIEVGGGFLYHLTNTFGLKAGVQLNVRQYNIEAYRAPVELTTIALFRSSGNDTISTLARYRNHNGSLPTELINRYYQISVPIGLQWQVIGTDRVNLNIAATLQPTYYLSRNSYLLSTNFKNYTDNGGMLRNWNINSSIETFISLKAGDFNWQFGPQFRYQHLPTFSSQYPIREYLMDYGFKVGVSKVIK